MRTIIFDFSRTLLFPVDKNWNDSLNKLNQKLLDENSNYNFLNNFYLNEEILDFLEEIKNKFDFYIFTTGTVQNNPVIIHKLNLIFKHIFTVEEIGFDKVNKNAYLEISNKINQKPEDIIFIDDEITNLKVAQKVNIKVFQYTTNSKLLEFLKNLK